MIRRCLLLLVGVGAIVLAIRSASGQKTEVPTDPDDGLVERATVELLLLEVEAIDGEGRPLRGLRPEAFAVKIDGHDWPVASVDDFCQCDGPAGPSPTTTGTNLPPSAAPQTTTSRPADVSEPGRYVLYFDFGQMRQGGRYLATKEARQWVEKVKTDADEVMIAAYITRQGYIKLCDFTPDRARLLEVLDRAYRDRSLVDTWAASLEARLEECEDDPSTCIHFARQEYTHGRRTLAGLRGFRA